jgi:hypothetical protein
MRGFRISSRIVLALVVLTIVGFVFLWHQHAGYAATPGKNILDNIATENKGDSSWKSHGQLEVVPEDIRALEEVDEQPDNWIPFRVMTTNIWLPRNVEELEVDWAGLGEFMPSDVEISVLVRTREWGLTCQLPVTPQDWRAFLMPSEDDPVLESLALPHQAETKTQSMIDAVRAACSAMTPEEWYRSMFTTPTDLLKQEDDPVKAVRIGFLLLGRSRLGGIDGPLSVLPTSEGRVYIHQPAGRPRVYMIAAFGENEELLWNGDFRYQWQSSPRLRSETLVLLRSILLGPSSIEPATRPTGKHGDRSVDSQTEHQP